MWGYQTVHLTLDLGGAPSWKPLTYLFTVPFALFGHYEMWLWMFFSAAVALAGAVFARPDRVPAERRRDGDAG